MQGSEGAESHLRALLTGGCTPSKHTEKWALMLCKQMRGLPFLKSPNRNSVLNTGGRAKGQ